MARNAGATREEVESILGKYRASGLTRQEYCQREGLTVYTLDYYQRRLYKLREREAASANAKARTQAPPTTPRIARVIEARDVNSATATATATAAPTGFALKLSNGRRIEVNGWGFRDLDLARLIRIAEQA